MTTTTTVGDGQIIVPKEILQSLHMQSGDTVAIETLPDGSIRIFPKTMNASEVAGMLKTKIRSTIEEMDEAVAEAFRKSP
ncbi:MAG TPA: AbrB/MazE/SpoVT family DNA-binding domain-containing protein [Candidatus Hydrogenedentes bacterium]|nr:MAG: hypothetical protein BWY09_00737 [Candidatus Hydrogenedentes bacterium ADurb.Bin179]HOH28414.1 AbrB/MazE/SpoVT family DNA-binding domain-containing protein [Candidatus Hydrogenedentota bacterium]